MHHRFMSRTRVFAAAAVIVVLTMSVSAAPREQRGPREKGNSLVKVIKKVIKSLGDGLTIPKP